jgi:ubiquinol-cytochrome c reductase cytochrome b subunit
VRIGIFLVPALTYVITKRICLALQRRERDKLLHGRETGRIRRLPHGEFIEVHEPLDPYHGYTLMARDDYKPLPKPQEEHDGVRNPAYRKQMLRYKLSRWLYGGHIAKPTREEIEHALEHGHGDDTHGLDSSDGHVAIGAQRSAESREPDQARD